MSRSGTVAAIVAAFVLGIVCSIFARPFVESRSSHLPVAIVPDPADPNRYTMLFEGTGTTCSISILVVGDEVSMLVPGRVHGANAMLRFASTAGGFSALVASASSQSIPDGYAALSIADSSGDGVFDYATWTNGQRPLKADFEIGKVLECLMSNNE